MTDRVTLKSELTGSQRVSSMIVKMVFSDFMSGLASGILELSRVVVPKVIHTLISGSVHLE